MISPSPSLSLTSVWLLVNLIADFLKILSSSSSSESTFFASTTSYYSKGSTKSVSSIFLIWSSSLSSVSMIWNCSWPRTSRCSLSFTSSTCGIISYSSARSFSSSSSFRPSALSSYLSSLSESFTGTTSKWLSTMGTDLPISKVTGPLASSPSGDYCSLSSSTSFILINS